MISDSLLWHLVLAFAVGSIWVTLVTVVAERFGSAAGGVMGGLPSTSAFSFFFIGINQSPNAAAQATTVFPLAFSFTCAFLLFYAFFVKRGFRVGLSISLLLWFAISGLIVVSGLKDFTLSLIGCILVSSLVYYTLVERLKLENLIGTQTSPTASQLVLRAVIAGSIVVLAVSLSQIGGPTLGGIFSAFPAVFTSTLYLTNKSDGAGFSRAMTKPLMVSAILTVIPFSVTLRYAYPTLGVWLGTVCSYSVVAPFAVAAYLITRGYAKGERPASRLAASPAPSRTG
jgi:uncharacterized membrane protein (GlpM family)